MLEELIGKYAEVKCIKIYYGKIDNGEPLVMIHPSGLDGRFYHKLLNFITRDITIIIVDLLDHGKSDVDPI
jgi:pimeloyl-ACP methyl ester carboxylesterase